MRDKKKKPFSESRKYSKYKLDNWPEYNEFLRNRGRIDVMISNNLAKGWYEQHSNGYRKREIGRASCRERVCMFV